MPYGNVAAFGLPIAGIGGALGIGWLVVGGVTLTLLSFGVLGLVNLRRRQLSGAIAQLRNVSRPTDRGPASTADRTR